MLAIILPEVGCYVTSQRAKNCFENVSKLNKEVKISC